MIKNYQKQEYLQQKEKEKKAKVDIFDFENQWLIVEMFFENLN
jgi:hypothetical protein